MHIHMRVWPNDEGASGKGVNLRNTESQHLEPFFYAASFTSRNTIPFFTPTVINDLDTARGHFNGYIGGHSFTWYAHLSLGYSIWYLTGF